VCDCPGDKANGITPAPIRTVTAVLEEDEDESSDDFVATIFPTYVLGDGSFSEGDDEDNKCGDEQ
jgi:hypothetical protein